MDISGGIDRSSGFCFSRYPTKLIVLADELIDDFCLYLFRVCNCVYSLAEARTTVSVDGGSCLNLPCGSRCPKRMQSFFCIISM